MPVKLQGENLCLFRGEKCLFQGLNFEVGESELLLVEGSNGSGKTSLLRAVAGLIQFEEGDIHWKDEPVSVNRQRFLGDMGWLAHRVGFKGDLSLAENLRFETGLRSVDRTDMMPVLERLGIERLLKLPLRALSAGQQRRSALARLILVNARLWLMDEPFANLDAAGRDLVLELISEHLDRGGLCMLAAHQEVEMNNVMHRLRL